VSTLRLAVPRSYFCDVLDDEVRASFESALADLRKSGARVDDASIAHADTIAPIYMHISFGDAAAYHAATLDTMPDRYTEPVRLRLELARYVLAEDYVRALAGRDVLVREVDAALSGHDALVLPSLPIPAPIIGANSVEVGNKKESVRALMLRQTQLFNLSGHPAMSIPCGATRSGLPIGLQIVGGRFHTETLLKVAVSVERALQR
jgi:aspartyl-tRNA(Asn)/glutamyl-tRNA(Gln) amidotransferase subunit A